MEWVGTNPDKPGKYIVETKTMMGNTTTKPLRNETCSEESKNLQSLL
jgi:hypothetical protein